MNPFDEQNMNQDNNIQQIPFRPRFGGLNLIDQPSRVERFIDRASGSIKRVLIFIGFVAGLLAVIALTRPYFHFLKELEKWAHRVIDYIFY